MKFVREVSINYKNPSLRRWRVREVTWPNGTRSRHVHGHDVTNDSGRVSSAIREFDRKVMTATTHSGSNYKLMGAPGNARSGETAWQNWCSINGIVAHIDVTTEYFIGDKVVTTKTPSVEIS